MIKSTNYRKHAAGRTPVGEQGFNLIELMIAMVILSVGLMALGGMQIAAIQSNGEANKDSEAVHLASRYLEQIIRDENYDVPDEIDGYTIEVESEGSADGSGTWYTVTVSYTGRYNIDRTTSLRYLRANGSP